jgi:hypothetical protein
MCLTVHHLVQGSLVIKPRGCMSCPTVALALELRQCASNGLLRERLRCLTSPLFANHAIEKGIYARHCSGNLQGNLGNREKTSMPKEQ